MSREKRQPQVFSTFQERFTLGQLEGDFPIDMPEEARDAVITLAEQARRIIKIFTRELDSDVYDNPRFVSALSFVARRTPTSEVQILVQDPKPAINSNHLLIELCQQLTSYIKVRRVSEDYQLAPDEFLLADRIGFMYRKSYSAYEGVVNFNSAPKAQRLDEVFNEIWNVSTADPEFRLLHI